MEFEWVLTAAHCVTVVEGGEMCFCERLRVRIPIQEKWSCLNEHKFNTRNTKELFEDVIVPIVENVNVFVYEDFRDHPSHYRGTDIALIRIPPILRPERNSLINSQRKHGSTIESTVVVGFPVTVSL